MSIFSTMNDLVRTTLSLLTTRCCPFTIFLSHCGNSMPLNVSYLRQSKPTPSDACANSLSSKIQYEYTKSTGRFNQNGGSSSSTHHQPINVQTSQAYMQPYPSFPNIATNPLLPLPLPLQTAPTPPLTTCQ